jgi:isocitrate dehydrogenase kinase/phosphatase
MHRTYFHNDFIFVRPAISTDFIESDPPAYRSYYPNRVGLRQTIRDICDDFDWQCTFANLERDIEHVISAVVLQMGGRLPAAEANFQLQVLHSAFYRNKGAYIVGKAVNGDYEYPSSCRSCTMRTAGCTWMRSCSTRRRSAPCSASAAPIS